MKTFAVVISLAVLAGCAPINSDRRDTAQSDTTRHETAGEKAGRAAYELKKDTEKAAQELRKEVKNFSRDAKEGYHEQKAKDQARKEEK